LFLLLPNVANMYSLVVIFIPLLQSYESFN